MIQSRMKKKTNVIEKGGRKKNAYELFVERVEEKKTKVKFYRME